MAKAPIPSNPSPRQVFEQAMDLLHTNRPEDAAAACAAALRTTPGDVDLLTLHGVSLLACRQPQDAVEPLLRAAALAPKSVRVRENLGQALMQSGQTEAAEEQLRLAASLDPNSETVRMKLGHLLASRGAAEEADSVFEEAFGLAPDRRRLAEAGEHLREGRIAQCAYICRDLLARNPEDVNALRLLAKVEMDADHWDRAEHLLLRALKLAPAFHDAMMDLARVYKQQDRLDDALRGAREAAEGSPRNPNALYLEAGLLALAGRSEEALAAYRRCLDLQPAHTPSWLGMGHLLKTLGRTEEGIASYRRAIEQRPNFGEVHWSLANLKTFRFSDAEVADMERRLEHEDLDDDARVHFLFTLGKALEDRGEYARAFEHYARGAGTQRQRISYDPVETEVVNERIRAVFCAEFLAANRGRGCADPAPIFIVGLPRSGSTLIEQVLASHSRVEGTAELPEVARVIAELSAQRPNEAYPEAARRLDAAGWYALGESYLERAGRHRSGLPRFTDKMPNNFPAIGLIHLMLPNAKIVDARRHPLDSCFGSFKQHFAFGQAWSYDLEEIGEYYREYRRMMRHWREVLPGKVLEVRYEDMVQDLESQTRRLLEYCDLPWEEACLRFYETERAVRTASSEQVRQPIYSSSVNHWRHYRRQLAPLTEILANDLDGWDS